MLRYIRSDRGGYRDCASIPVLSLFNVAYSVLKFITSYVEPHVQSIMPIILDFSLVQQHFDFTLDPPERHVYIVN
jgi:hypothetical protein